MKKPLKPPEELGFPSSFSLPIPIINNSPDYNKVLNDTAKFIANIYDINTI